MLQLLDFTHKNIIATSANDLLGIKDFEKIHPLIHNIINTEKKVRWYFEMDDGTASASTGFWEDGSLQLTYGTLNFTHSADIEKIAIVGTQKWKKLMYEIMAPFEKAEIKYFDIAEREMAKNWLMQ
ncbi:MAG TPA: STAS/SEC14 domain-containing protein [Flavisolibacter sp.]|nr:STAS/SEC14 domain-containing protein [Flavisolibacter sp.]